MIKCKIFGAGSVGNHLAQAARRAGWAVTVVDVDPQALLRMKQEIYPSRYGAWDEAITLCSSGDEPVGGFEVIMIGTPPEYHLPLATQVLEREAPRVLQIEKPLCGPGLEGLVEFMTAVRAHPDTMIVAGYDHVLGENTKKTEEILLAKPVGQILTIDAETRSTWDGILRAHPWLKGPEDSYLGHWQKGGGASGEHSHALNLWQHFAHVGGAGRVAKVSAVFDFVKTERGWYDRLCFFNLTAENGLMGRLVQDVVTVPKKKTVTLQGEKGRVEWYCDVTKTLDRVVVVNKDETMTTTDIAKTRPDEFFQEIMHIQNLLDDKEAYTNSPIRLERGLDTMFVLNAAHRSFAGRGEVAVSYDPTRPIAIKYD